MNFIKVCMECGNEFEDEELFNDIIVCKNCGSPDIDQVQEISYYDISLEDCFIMYHTKQIACECDGDNIQVNYCKE